jgi:hypothetical protein
MKNLILFVLFLVLFTNVQICFGQTPPSSIQFSCGATSPGVQSNTPSNFIAICPDPNAIKYLRVAIHFLLPSNIVFKNSDNFKNCLAPYNAIRYIGAGNFTEFGDGFQNPDYNGFLRANDIVDKANEELSNNSDQWRKSIGISYPNTPPKTTIRYLLVGTYFHRDDVGYYLKDPNDPSKSETTIAFDTHDKYGVGGTQIIDIYYTPNGAWSGNAFQIGGSDKFIFNNDYWTYITCNGEGWSVNFSAQLLNHEVGHTLNLRHTWNENDNCQDTPNGFIYNRPTIINGVEQSCSLNENSNCWMYDPSLLSCISPNQSDKPCDDWSKVSNNIMDYNQYFPHAYTTCQISLINSHLISNTGNSYIHSCNGCMPSKAFFFMQDEYHFCPPSGDFPLGSSINLNGQGSFNENKYLIEICEVNPLQPSICLGTSYYSSGWQNGKIGIVRLNDFYTFSPNHNYKITLTVDNTNCPPSDVYEKVISIKNCTATDPNCCPFAFATQNPIGDLLQIYYSTSQSGMLNMQLINQYSGAITPIMTQIPLEPGDYQIQQNLSGLPTGNYAIIAQFKGVFYTKTLLKL